MTTCALSELFDVTYGVNLELNALEHDREGINFVARTEKNNGITARVKRIPYIEPIPAGTISVAGGGSVMESFLQSKPYYSGRDLFYLTPKVKMTDEVKLFYCHCLRMNKFKYSYGRQANITLPTIQVPCLDEAIGFVGQTSIVRLRERMTSRLNLADLREKSRVSADEYDKVPLSTLFNTKNGTFSGTVRRCNYKKNDNWIPFIRPSYKQSTSIDAYVNKNMVAAGEIFPAGTLYVSTDGQGSHTYSYVSVSEFVPNSNITVLIPKKPMTIREKLFYAMCISHNRYKFSYGRKPKGEKLEGILVPDRIRTDFDSLDIDRLINSMFS